VAQAGLIITLPFAAPILGAMTSSRDCRHLAIEDYALARRNKVD
jgi:hypothetical protein